MLVLSASGPVASVALFENASLVKTKEREAGHRASQCLIELTDEMLNEFNMDLSDIDCFCADRGPGSFIGVRVGITLAKSWGFALDRPVASLSAFDLVLSGSCIQSRKGFFFVREKGAVSLREGFTECSTPRASLANVSELAETAPEQLLPEYVLEPSISTPKVPYAQA